MKIPKRPTDPFEYKPKELEGVTVKMKPLSVGTYDQCTGLILNKEHPAALRMAAYEGVIGWSGFDEEFTLEELKKCEDAFVYELGGAVLTGAQITETEKNS